MKTKTKRKPPKVGVVEACRRVHRAFLIKDSVMVKTLGLKGDQVAYGR
jgi:hypothetical protein